MGFLFLKANDADTGTKSIDIPLHLDRVFWFCCGKWLIWTLIVFSSPCSKDSCNKLHIEHFFRIHFLGLAKSRKNLQTLFLLTDKVLLLVYLQTDRATVECFYMIDCWQLEVCLFVRNWTMIRAFNSSTLWRVWSNKYWHHSLQQRELKHRLVHLRQSR